MDKQDNQTKPPVGADLAQALRDVLDERKAEGLRILDVRGLSGVTDFYVLANAANEPHLKALTQELNKRMKATGAGKSRRVTGAPASGWVVLDFIDVIVHLFLPSMRTHYALEELWNDAPELKPAG